MKVPALARSKPFYGKMPGVSNVLGIQSSRGNVYLLVCHVPFPAQGAGFLLHRAGNHMTDQQIYFSG